jgi:hypothetical protein
VLFEKFKEGLEIIIKLWENDKVTFKGKYYTLTEAVLLPKPLQKPRPPLLIGGVGRRTLKIAAEFLIIGYHQLSHSASPHCMSYDLQRNMRIAKRLFKNTLNTLREKQVALHLGFYSDFPQKIMS